MQDADVYVGSGGAQPGGSDWRVLVVMVLSGVYGAMAVLVIAREDHKK